MQPEGWLHGHGYGRQIIGFSRPVNHDGYTSARVMEMEVFSRLYLGRVITTPSHEQVWRLELSAAVVD